MRLAKKWTLTSWKRCPPVYWTWRPRESCKRARLYNKEQNYKKKTVEFHEKMKDDITYTASNLRQDGDMQISGTLPGDTGTVHNPEDANRKYDCGDTNSDDQDNHPIRSEMERTQEETRHSPKRNKKMKIDKNGEQQTEQSRSLHTQMTHKSWKN